MTTTYLCGTKTASVSCSSSDSDRAFILKPGGMEPSDENVYRPQYDYRSTTASQAVCRVVIIGSCLSFIHSVGLIVAIAVLVERLMDPEMPEKAVNHICTTAILCPLYNYFEGLSGISIQLVGSVCGLTINLMLILGALSEVAWALLVWLLCYAFATCGCIVLFGIMLNTLLVRDSVEHDVRNSTMLFTLIPVLMAFIYIVCWFIVLHLWKRIKKRENRVFVCVD